MDVHALDQALAIVDGTLTLTASILPGVSLQPLLFAYNSDQPLIISGAQKKVTTDTVTVTGTCPFMRVPALPVTARFRVDASGTPVAELHFTLIGATAGPNSWRFSTSFPDLPLFLDYGKSITKPQLPLLDELLLSNASFVLTTRAGKDQASGVPLAVGLNFIATLRPAGLTGLFDALLGGSKQVTLFGTITVPVANQVTPLLPNLTYPWQTQWPVPGLQLQAALGINFTLAKLKFDTTILRIYTPLTNVWQAANTSYQPTTAVSTMLHIASANISVEAIAEVTRNYPSIDIAALFAGANLSDLAHLADLANGSDLLNTLPAAVKQQITQLGGLSLERASIGLTTSLSPETVTYVSLTVGMPKLQWTVLPGFTLESMFVDFIIDSPFAAQGRAVSALVGGTLDIGGVLLDVTTQVPNFVAWAELQDETSLPLNAFFAKYAPELPALPDLSVDETQLVITPGQGYSFVAVLAEDPAWTLDLGPTPLTIENINVEISKEGSSTAQATLNGTLQIGTDLVLTTSYTLPGEFFIRADLPAVKLSSLIALFNEAALTLPPGFDLDFAQSYVLIERVGSELSFSAATTISNLGLLAFTVQRQGSWGFALGVDLSTSGLAAVPGLSALAPFESFIGLETLMLVVSSLDVPTGFQFPDFANFNVPSLGTGRLRLPVQASGLTRGLNFYALLSTSKSSGFQALAKYLGIALNGTVGITLAVSLPDPVTNSKLFLSINETIQPGTTLVGELGGLLQGSDVGVFLTAIVKTQVQNQPLEFDVTAVVLDDGVLISGTVQGTLQFGPVQLSNLALVIGVDFEGIPSLGIAATLDISNFDTALALFFDSADPAKSLLAGAISNVTLLDIVKGLANQQNLPAELSTVLGLVGLKALKAFSMPAAVAAALDNRNLSAIAAAFQQSGSVTIPATSDHILLVITTKGAAWHLTDLSTMQHYSLELAGANIAVSLQPQLYLAPQNTFIGALQYPQGFDVTAEINYLLFQIQLKILINTNQGIAADADVAPIILLSRDFFSITGASAQGGPIFSLATYSQPNLSDPQLRAPHFLVSGQLRLLGVDMAAIYVLISEHGLTFDIAYQVNPILHVDLHGSFTSLTNLTAGGAIVVGLNHSLDLGALGSVQVNINVNGTLSVEYTGASPAATFQGGFVFQGIQATIPTLTLDANGPALQNIESTLWSQVSDILNKLLKNPDQWLSWVHSNVIQNAGQTADQVGHILASVYQLSADDIASKTKQILGYDITNTAEALRGAGATANQAVSALKNVGYQAADISSVIASVFTHTHADTNIGHVDTPAGPHVDAPTTHADVPQTHVDTTNHADIPGSHIDTINHADVPGSHIDTTNHADIPGTHTDSSTFFGHIDQSITPHADSNPHVDQTTTPHGDSNPHIDQTTTPHGDSNPHVDQTTTPHTDTTTPHVDNQVPHGDTNTHVDVNA